MVWDSKYDRPGSPLAAISTEITERRRSLGSLDTVHKAWAFHWKDPGSLRVASLDCLMSKLRGWRVSCRLTLNDSDFYILLLFFICVFLYPFDPSQMSLCLIHLTFGCHLFVDQGLEGVSAQTVAGWTLGYKDVLTDLTGRCPASSLLWRAPQTQGSCCQKEVQKMSSWHEVAVTCQCHEDQEVAQGVGYL